MRGAASPPQPFFAASPAAPSTSRLLLLSPRFPPCEEVGALRWQKLTGALAEHGWAADVVTLHPDSLPSRDERRLAELPRGTRVFGVPAGRLAIDGLERRVVRTLHRLRVPDSRAVAPPASGSDGGAPGSLAMADARGPLHSVADLRRAYHALVWTARDGAWARRAVAAAGGIAEAARYRAVITCGPPHMIHFAAVALARRIGVPLVLDLRDPWSLVERLPERYASTLYRRVAARYEARAVRAAALVVTATEQSGAALASRYPHAASKQLTVLNGFDADAPPAAAGAEGFTVAYAGTIYLDRDPRPLLRAVATVVQRERLSPHQLRLLFLSEMPTRTVATLEALAVREGLEAHLTVRGRLPRTEALGELAGADLLVVLHQDSHLAIPGKLFEYMALPAWIMAMADAGSAVSEVLAGTPAEVVAPGDVEAMAAVISRCMGRKRRTGRPAPLAASVPGLSRARQAASLAEALARLTGRR
jgi:glycosyltransferase involved in cell wall biosynthesis